MVEFTMVRYHFYIGGQGNFLTSVLAVFQVMFYEEERDIMTEATSPWITALHYAFQVRSESSSPG